MLTRACNVQSKQSVARRCLHILYRIIIKILAFYFSKNVKPLTIACSNTTVSFKATKVAWKFLCLVKADIQAKSPPSYYRKSLILHKYFWWMLQEGNRNTLPLITDPLLNYSTDSVSLAHSYYSLILKHHNIMHMARLQY